MKRHWSARSVAAPTMAATTNEKKPWPDLGTALEKLHFRSRVEARRAVERQCLARSPSSARSRMGDFTQSCAQSGGPSFRPVARHHGQAQQAGEQPGEIRGG